MHPVLALGSNVWLDFEAMLNSEFEQEMLAQARLACEAASRLPYPAGLKPSAWWEAHSTQTLQLMKSIFDSVTNVVEYAQEHISGFDHRTLDPERIRAYVHFKLAELRLYFPNFNPTEYPGLQESKFSIQHSLFAVGPGGWLLSNIFLTHLYFCLRTQSFASKQKPFRRILEIGTGYGGLARIYKTMCPGVTYTLTDLPESLFYANVFLRANFPEARTFYVTDAYPANPSDYDFIFVPAQLSPLLAGQSFDLTLNTGSLQEMAEPTANYWMDLIQNRIRTDFFYSWNYFLNDRTTLPEVKDTPSFICPQLDRHWEITYFRINDPVITIDCAQRNWLEVCVRRLQPSDPRYTDSAAYANQLLEAANTFQTGTNYWLANVWMAAWVSPSPQIIEGMLHGIAGFSSGKCFGIQNYTPHNNHNYSEITFYKEFLAVLKAHKLTQMQVQTAEHVVD